MGEKGTSCGRQTLRFESCNLGVCFKSPIILEPPTIYRSRFSNSSIYGALGSVLSSFEGASQEFPKKTETSRCKEAGSFLAYDSHASFPLTNKRMFATLGFHFEGPLLFGFGEGSRVRTASLLGRRSKTERLPQRFFVCKGYPSSRVTISCF